MIRSSSPPTHREARAIVKREWLFANRSPMTDEQRKAMFASMGGGRGGGGRSSSSGSNRSGFVPEPTPQTPPKLKQSGGYNAAPSSTSGPTAAQKAAMLKPNDSKLWATIKGALSGFGYGAKGGATIVADKMTLGSIPSLSKIADTYKGSEFDVSRGAATVARESLIAATGIGIASKLGAAWEGTALARSAAGKHLAPFLAVGGFGVQSQLNDYRAENPTINPYADKALAMGAQLSGYIGSIGALGTLTKYGGALLSKIPVSAGRSLSDLVKSGLKIVDSKLGAAGQAIGKRLNPKVATLLKKAYDGYSKFSEFTGSTFKDLAAAHRAIPNLRRAKALASRASDTLKQAATIAKEGAIKEGKLKDVATSALMDAHKASLAKNPAAEKMYAHARNAFYAVDDAAAGSAKAAAQLKTHAAKLTIKADALTADAASRIKKAAYVATGITAVGAYDEVKINQYQKEAAQAIRDGKTFAYPKDDPRNIIGTIAATAIGTTGNPIEKQFRPGRSKWQAEVGAYRAGYEAIVDAGRNGELSEKQVQQQLVKLAAQKPYNMSGKEIWSFAPAAAAFLNWKIGDAISKGKRSEIAQRVPGSYIDGDTVSLVDRPPVRLLDINAPEVAHAGHNDPDHPERTTGELFGKESAAYAAKLIKDGQYVRVVEDSNKRAGGTDKYGREVRTLETLPKPFDQLLRIPYLGKIIPAKEFQGEMIKAGLADVDYRELSGRTDISEAHDKLRAAAQTAGIGIWSQEGRADPQLSKWVGTEKSVQQLRVEAFARATKGSPMPDAPISDLSTALGLGLMTSGNSGIFQQMPASGSAVAQTYNAILAALGALEYNERARRTAPRSAPGVKALKTDYDRSAEAILARYRSGLN